MSQIDLVIFDCDGTLIDSEILACRVEAEEYTKIGYEIDWETFSERFAGKTTEEIMQEIFDELGRPTELSFLDLIHEKVEEAFATQLQSIEGAKTLLANIEHKFCICSNSDSERLVKSLKTTSLSELTSGLAFSAKDVGEKKPKPDPSVFNYAIEKFGAAPKRTFVLEDSTTGVQAAKAANCRVIGFTGASHSFAGHADKLTDAGAETVITRLSDVLPTIAALADWQPID